MRPAVFEPIADNMLLRHAERVAISSALLETLAEREPERWGVIVDQMQQAIVNAYETRSIEMLGRTLSVIENVYRDVARQHGRDPATGKMQ